MTLIIPWVYGIQSQQFIKIGVANSISVRMRQFRAGNPHLLRLVIQRQVPEAYWLEKRLHQILVHRSVGREWFEITIDEGRAAMKIAMTELQLYRKKQAEWEQQSSERLAKKELAKCGADVDSA
jgi:T5orf172 domain